MTSDAVGLVIRELRAEDIPVIVSTDGGAAWNGGHKKWDRRWAEHLAGERLCLVAEKTAEQTGARAAEKASKAPEAAMKTAQVTPKDNAANAPAIVGYGSLMWRSPYRPFRDEGIPEIQDLVVAESCRGRGIGRALIEELEERARTAGYAKVGLGVGLYRDYGRAQRLYVAMGYKLDGRGITYKYETLRGGETVRVDDDLLVWMVKSIG